MNKRAALDLVVAAVERGEPVALVTAVAGSGAYAAQVGRHLVVPAAPEAGPDGNLELGEAQAGLLADVRRLLRERRSQQLIYTAAPGVITVFVEVEAPPPHLIIVGAGHIAVPLAAMAHICEFVVTVLDDRPQYANQQRFPTARQVIAGPLRSELRNLRPARGVFGSNTCIVLVTRGHQYDVDCLLEVLDDPLAYLGMIGSQRRIQAVYTLLEREQGIAAGKFDKIYAPVGLSIGAQTPAEIGLCIMAEIVNVLRGGPGLSLSEQLRRQRAARRAQLTPPEQPGENDHP